MERVERQRCRDERDHEPDNEVAQERVGGEAADRHDDADQREAEDPDQHAAADPVDVVPLVRVAGHQQAVRIEVAEELGDERPGDLGQRPTEVPGFVQADEQGVRREQVEEQEGYEEEAVDEPRARDRAPPVAARVDEEPEGEQRAEQPAQRVRVGDQREDRREQHDRPARRARRAGMEREQEAPDERRHQGDLHGQPGRLERPWQEEGHRGSQDGDEATPGHAVCQRAHGLRRRPRPAVAERTRAARMLGPVMAKTAASR